MQDLDLTHGPFELLSKNLQVRFSEHGFVVSGEEFDVDLLD
jgi:hypothetical protein